MDRRCLDSENTGKQSVRNAQLETLNVQRSSSEMISLSVERWKLKVERSGSTL